MRPTPAVPSSWPVGAAYPPAGEATLPSVSYRDIFRDPHLQSIIGAALANNQDLQAALANVEIARAQYRVQRAQLLPKVDAAASAGESQTHTQAAGVTTQRRQIDRSFAADVGFSSFELDLFGRLRSLKPRRPAAIPGERGRGTLGAADDRRRGGRRLSDPCRRSQPAGRGVGDRGERGPQSSA